MTDPPPTPALAQRDPFAACGLCGRREYRGQRAHDGTFVCFSCRDAVEAYVLALYETCEACGAKATEDELCAACHAVEVKELREHSNAN